MNPEVNRYFASNGEKALTLLLSSSIPLPDCIILDLNMPACDGIETLSSIKNIRRFNLIPIIIFSTTDNEQDRNRALSAGAVAFVTKPSSFRELEVLIESFTTFFV